VDAAGILFIADTEHNRILRVDGQTRTITTVAGNGDYGFGGDGGPATSASLAFPGDVAVDGSGNLFIMDSENRRIRRVDGLTGTITTVSVDIGSLSVAVDAAGNLFIADNGTDRIRRVDAQ